MTTIKNTTGTKAVNIFTDATGAVRAMFIQIYNGEEQVLESKNYLTFKKALKWANTKIKQQYENKQRTPETCKRFFDL